MEQEELVGRYRRLRRIAATIQDDALESVPAATLVEFGRRIGAASHRELVCAAESELRLVYDLAIHTARPGRSRAIDRYARSARFVAGSDEQRMLQALQSARFVPMRIESRHPIAGAMALDTLEQRQFHLMDIALGKSAGPGISLVGRLLEIDGFRMSCMALVPTSKQLLDQAFDRYHPDRDHSISGLFRDPRFVAALYRAALACGTMRDCITLDPSVLLPTEADIRSLANLNDRLSLGLPALTAVG